MGQYRQVSSSSEKGTPGVYPKVARNSAIGLAPGFGGHSTTLDTEAVSAITARPLSGSSSTCPLSWSVYPVASVILVIVVKSFRISGLCPLRGLAM